MEVSTNKTTRKRRPIRLVVAVIVLGLVFAGGFWLIRSRSSAGNPVQVEAGDQVAAFLGNLSARATASGRLEPVRSANLSFAQQGTVTEVSVAAGNKVREGAPLIHLDQRDLTLQVERMQQNVALKEANLQALLQAASAADVAAAEAALQSAEAELDDLLRGPTSEEVAEYEALIRQQQAGIATASASYNTTRDSVAASTLAGAEAELVAAEIAYDQAKERNEDFAFSFTHEALLEAERDLRIAQAKVEELRAGPKQGSLSSASADISAAQANLQKAQADLDRVLQGPSAAEIAAAEAAVVRAKADLAELVEGASEQEITIAEAELVQARLELLSAEESLQDAVLLAPFSGMVTGVLVSVGERASGTVIEMVSEDLQVELQVDELDVGSLEVGQSARFSLEAFPGESLEGVVRSIAPSASNDDTIVTYDVIIAFEAPELPLLVGMTADAELLTEERQNVLLVPNAAITPDRRNGTYLVNLVVGEEEGQPVTEEREVRIGLQDRTYTQIVSGLEAGDEVLVGELAPPTIDFGNGFGDGGDE